MSFSVFCQKSRYLIIYVLGVLGSLFLPSCRQILIEATFKPRGNYQTKREPTQPDYAKTSSWAALPDRKDTADHVPKGETNRQSTSGVDVFFVHPTTYIRGENWNPSLTNRKVNFHTDWHSIRNQASAFNDCCRVYAPRYRQAILYAFMTEQSDGAHALDLAYRDVREAFRTFLKHYNKRRPFILAGHSQGSYHLLRLLEEEISGKPIRTRFVVAYLVGIPIPRDKIRQTLPDIPVCQHAKQTGCLISWNTFGPNASSERLQKFRNRYPKGLIPNGSKPIVCVNPLTWRTTEVRADATTNKGGVIFLNKPSSIPKPDSGLVSARCQKGVLNINQPAFYRYRKLSLAGDYHNVDYQLFYMNTRKNAVVRVKSFFDKRKKVFLKKHN